MFKDIKEVGFGHGIHGLKKMLVTAGRIM